MLSDSILLNSYGTLCLVSWTYSELTLNVSRYTHMKSFPQPNPFKYKALTLKTNSWLLQFYKSMVYPKLCKGRRVCFDLALR